MTTPDKNPSSFDTLLALAREHIERHGYVFISREALKASWLSAGLAPELSKRLDVQWSRDDKNGGMWFGD
jgi:hypothetical protein